MGRSYAAWCSLRKFESRLFHPREEIVTFTNPVLLGVRAVNGIFAHAAAELPTNGSRLCLGGVGGPDHAAPVRDRVLPLERQEDHGPPAHECAELVEKRSTAMHFVKSFGLLPGQ